MTDNWKIIEENNKIFKIIFSYPNPVLINSLLKTKILQGATSSDNYKMIKFKADSVKSLHQFQVETGKSQLHINQVASLIKNLSSQLNYLLKVESHTIIGYNPENIIVINDHIFAFLGGEFISRVSNNMALISYPFTPHDFFLSPELLKIKTIPSNVHYKTAFFSLGCLALHLLLPDNEFYLKQEQIDLEKLLNSSPIKHTKLYWLLSRCLVLDPENRSILFI